MTIPILEGVGTVFVPVSDINKARNWYCDIFDITPSKEIPHGHLYVIPTGGTNIVLDSKIYSKDNLYKIPAFHINTTDIYKAYDYLSEKGVELVTEIENDHYFNFKDLDGNILMICE